MRILHIIDSLGSGGKERQLLELIKGFKDYKNIKFELAILSNKIDYLYAKDLNVRIHILSRKIKRDPMVFKKLFKICKDNQPDIIHSWESMCSVYALPIAKLFGIKFINGIIREAPSEMKPFAKVRIRSKLTFPFSDIVLANSYAGLKSFKVAKNKGCCIYNGFDFSRINNLEKLKNVKKQFNINSPKIVGMVASFSHRKDYGTFIYAATKILQKRDDTTFLAIGNGTKLKECKKMVKPESKERIQFLGHQKNVESIINIFDVGVLSTYQEGLANSIMEYMALGKPVVATRCDALSEIVLNKVTGFLVPASNPKELSEKIEFFLNNRKVAEKMGRAGKERLLNEFSLGIMTKKYYDAYRQVLCLEKNN